MQSALIACFLFHPAAMELRWLTVLATLLLGCSFGCSLLRMYPRRPA
jgi:hypothetical protein